MLEKALDQKFGAPKEKAPKPKAPKKPSAPVRNPAFREHEGLKELQRRLHRNNPNKK